MRRQFAAAALLAGCGAHPGAGPPAAPRIEARPAELPEGARAAAAELRTLLRLYRDEPPGPGRAELLGEMVDPLRTFMERGGGFAPLDLLAAAAEDGATGRERAAAFEALPARTRREVVDWLLDRARSPHAEVRERALGELAGAAGEERRRGEAALARGLGDPDAGVRETAARILAALAWE